MARLFESKTIDYTTGEVTSITQVTVKKLNERFSMCRTTEGLTWLKKFTGKELQLLIVLTDFENLQTRTVSLTPLVRKEIQSFFSIGKATLSGMITAMEDKGVLVRLTSSDLLLNPSYFYKGESKDVLNRINEFYRLYEEIRREKAEKVDNQSKKEENTEKE